MSYQQLNKVAAALSVRFVEREEIVKALMMCVAAKHHMLLLGPPGTAKSALLEALAGSVTGARSFVRLLTKHTDPSEVFGPFSIKGLQNDEFKRVTTGMLPDAHFAVLDEIFKCNSAMLNGLLTILNERAFDNGTTRIKVPLNTLIGASNETPQDESLGALYDRFLFRFYTNYIGDDDNFAEAAVASTTTAYAGPSLDLADIIKAQTETQTVKLEKAFILSSVVPLKRACESEGLKASDRRWFQSFRLLQACAYLDGRDVVGQDDLMIYKDILWDNPADRNKAATIVSKLINPALAEVQEHYDNARTLMQAITNNPNAGQGEALEAYKKIQHHQSKMGMLKAGKKGDELLNKSKAEWQKCMLKVYGFQAPSADK